MHKPIPVTKRPIVCQAMQFDGNAGMIMKWVIENDGYAWLAVRYGEEPFLHLRTLEGTMHVLRGSWVVQGVEGEFWAVRGDIFDRTYSINRIGGGEDLAV